jgi:hypothetical protein
MTANDASRIVITDYRVMLLIVVPLTDDSRSVINNHNMFIVQATGEVGPKRGINSNDASKKNFFLASTFKKGDHEENLNKHSQGPLQNGTLPPEPT